MKILQLNIWGGRLGAQVVDLLKKEDADIVCLQEVVSIPGSETLFMEDLDEIKSKCGYVYSLFSPQFGFGFMKRKAQFGIVILSKIPFVDTGEVYPGLIYLDDFDLLSDDYNVRPLQHVTVEYHDKRINILNHHGYHVPNHKNGDEETMRQCKIIVEYMEKFDGSIVLCGDFNLSPNSDSLEQINSVLVNHAKNQGVLTTRNSFTHKTEVCDYIFTSHDLETSNFKVLDDIASDHMALVINIAYGE